MLPLSVVILFCYSAEMPTDDWIPPSPSHHPPPSIQRSPSIQPNESCPSLPTRIPELTFNRSETPLHLETEKEEPGCRRVFRPFTKESYRKLVDRDIKRKLEEQRNPDGDEGRLVDGEIVFSDVADDKPRIKYDSKLVDGQPLPEKLGRMPREMEGVALEEIDPNIMEKVSI